MKGSTRGVASSCACSGQFEYQSEASGLMFLGRRYYDPSLCRFLTRDPVGDGSDWYAYCANDPLSMADPDGQIPLAVVLIVALLILSTDVADAPGPNEPPGHTDRAREHLAYEKLGMLEWLTPGKGVKSAIRSTPKIVPQVPLKARLAKPDFVVHGHDALPPFAPPGAVGARFNKDGQPRMIRQYGEGGYPRFDIDFGHGHKGVRDPHFHICVGKYRGRARDFQP
jgi:RHS repeat-associated protein